MSTTSSELAAATLSALEEAGVELAVLHGEDEIASGDVGSDIDLVTGAPLRTLLRGPARIELEKKGIFPVIVWPYDVAGTVTVFFSNADGSEGAQIDALHDPNGSGKFGIRSGVLLANSVPGRSWPVVQRPLSQLYLLRKRHWKRQYQGLAGEIDALRRLGSSEIDASTATMFEPTTQRAVVELLAGADPRSVPRESTRYRVRNLGRRLDRLTSSIGSWVEFSGAGAVEAAASASQRFSRFLPYCRGEDRPSTFSPAWWALRVAPIRLRPGLVVGVGEGRGWPRPDIAISVTEEGVPEAMRRLVGAMGDRALR